MANWSTSTTQQLPNGNECGPMTLFHMRAMTVHGAIPTLPADWPFEARDADRLRALLLRELEQGQLLWTAE